MWVVGQTATRCCVFFFNKIQHVLVEQNLIIGDSKVKNTELGIQRSEWVHSSPFINCVYPIYVPRMGLAMEMQRSKTRLAIEKFIVLGGVLSSLLKTMACGEASLCYSKSDSALIMLKS